MGGFQPVPIDPLPTVQQPQGQQQGGQPARLAEGAGDQSYPTQAGYMGKTGKTASIMSNFLSGWMAGKHMQEQKKLDAALKNVGNYETDYKNSMTIYQNILNNPDATQEQKDKAKQDVLTNWHELHEVQKKYIMPEDDKTKKKSVGTKIKDKVKGAFQAQDPHLFAMGAIDLADKTDPTAGMKPDVKEEAANLELSEMKKSKQQRDEYSGLLKKPTRSPEEQKRLESLEDEMYGPGTADKAKVATLQREEMDQNKKDLEAARKKYRDSGNKIEALNDRERSLMQNAGELPKDKTITTPFEAYMNDVGPGKKYATASQAADAYMKKEIDLAKASRQPTAWEDLTKAGQAVLGEQFAKDDADPKKPHTYRITINGKTEERQLTDEQIKAAQKQDPNLKAIKVPRVPTKGEVLGWVSERMRPSPDEKESAKPPKQPTPQQLNQEMGTVYATVIQGHPEWEKFTAMRPAPGGGVTMALVPFEESKVGFFHSKAAARKEYEDFLHAVQNEAISRGVGPYLNKVLPGMDDPVTPAEESSGPQAMTPTPQ